MKALLSIIFLFALTASTPLKIQETETLKATFVEYVEDTYYFLDKDDYSVEFQQIKKEVLDSYNLKDDSLKGKTFVITYETDTEEDEEGDDIQINIITGLKLMD